MRYSNVAGEHEECPLSCSSKTQLSLFYRTPNLQLMLLFFTANSTPFRFPIKIPGDNITLAVQSYHSHSRRGCIPRRFAIMMMMMIFIFVRGLATEKLLPKTSRRVWGRTKLRSYIQKNIELKAIESISWVSGLHSLLSVTSLAS